MRRERVLILAGLALAVVALFSLRSNSAEAQSFPAPPPGEGMEVAIFAGGCFWCMEQPFDAVDGVIDTTVGYTGGHVENPEYRQVTYGDTGHREAVRVLFDPSIVSYEQLLEVFWLNIDPVDGGGQFCDRGFSYTTAIFATSEAQRTAAEASLAELEASGALPGSIETEIVDAGVFYVGEAYHQDYSYRNPTRYTYYRTACGRDRRLQQRVANDELASRARASTADVHPPPRS